MIYDSKYIESDAFLMACEEDADTLDGHLRQFEASEVVMLREACTFLAKACDFELNRKRLD